MTTTNFTTQSFLQTETDIQILNQVSLKAKARNITSAMVTSSLFALCVDLCATLGHCTCHHCTHSLHDHSSYPKLTLGM